MYVNNRRSVQHLVRSSLVWNQCRTSDKELAALAKESPFCFIGNDGVLRRKSKDGKVQIIVLQKLTSRVLMMMHNDQGHFGYSKTLKRSQERYFWPKMSSQIDEWCKKCRVYQLTTRRPGELVTMDIVESIKSSGISLLPRND